MLLRPMFSFTADEFIRESAATDNVVIASVVVYRFVIVLPAVPAMF